MLTPQQFAAAYRMIPGVGSAAGAAVISYTTRSGDRWDTIAYAAYGDVRYMGALILANSQLPAYSQFDAGVTVLIPPLAAAPAVAASPPWRNN